MPKRASTDYPIHELIASRWSPYGFAERPVSADDLRSLFEAARWSASSYNEQPWSFLVATSQDGDRFTRLLSCLVEPNQAWAQAAPVLAITCTRTHFSRNDKPNAAAVHDVGLAVANLSLEATSRGISVHQMIGILPDRARELFHVPEGVQPLTALAIGFPAETGDLAEKYRDRDTASRQRKPLNEFVFADTWGETADLLEPSAG